MKLFVFVFTTLTFYGHVRSEIRVHRRSKMLSKLAHIKPVGGSKGLLPLTEIPPPRHPEEDILKSGRRHLPDECTKPGYKEIEEGPSVAIVGDYYDQAESRTVATVIIPEHIDHIHFEVTNAPAYYTVDGTIEGIGYHPSTAKPEHPNECERIYQEHLAEQYSDESQDVSEESMEVARVPMVRNQEGNLSYEQMYEEVVEGPN